MFLAFSQFHVSYDTTAIPQLSASSGTRCSCIEIYNAHYLVSYLRTNPVARKYILLNSPSLLFVGREGGGTERLTIIPIGNIVLSAVQVARPPNAPAFRICIVDRACTIRVSTFPSSNHPVPRAKIQSERQKPRTSSSTEYSSRSRILGKPGHQIQ